MSLSSASVWEVRPTNGSNTNGGGFTRGASGTDFSQQNAKNTVGTNISTTDGVGVGTTTWTSATGNFTAAIVGNIIYLAGTGITTGWYEATAFVNSTTITLDRSPGTGTGATMNIGGALATLTQLNTNMANGHQGWCKAESTISRSSLLTFNFTSTAFSFVMGYSSTRGDLGQVTLQASAGSFFLVAIANNNNLNTFTFGNFILDCNSQTSSSGIETQSFGNTLQNVEVKNYTSGTAFDISQGGSQGIVCRRCLATAGGGSGPVGWKTTSNLLGDLFVDCSVLSQSGGTGWLIGGGTYLRCYACNISGGGSDGFVAEGNSQGPTIFESCVAYTNGRDGFRFQSSSFGDYGVSCQNCISVSNGGFGFDNATGTTVPAFGNYFEYCATYNNASGASNALTLGSTCFTLSGDPFVNGSGNNFALNGTAGAGAACRAAGFPGVLLQGGTGFMDLGGLQHQAAGSSGMLYIPNLEGI